MREVRNSKNIPAMLLINLAYAIYSYTNASKYIRPQRLNLSTAGRWRILISLCCLHISISLWSL